MNFCVSGWFLKLNLIVFTICQTVFNRLMFCNFKNLSVESSESRLLVERLGRCSSVGGRAREPTSEATLVERLGRSSSCIWEDNWLQKSSTYGKILPLAADPLRPPPKPPWEDLNFSKDQTWIFKKSSHLIEWLTASSCIWCWSSEATTSEASRMAKASLVESLAARASVGGWRDYHN